MRPASPKKHSAVCGRGRRSRRWSAPGLLKLPNGRTLTGHSRDYKRQGTTTLFAAFQVGTGKVTTAHKKSRRRKEFLAFMDEFVATYRKTRLEVILDNNLTTHKKNEEWLGRHAEARAPPHARSEEFRVPLCRMHMRPGQSTACAADHVRSCRRCAG